MRNTYQWICFLLLTAHTSFGQDVKGHIRDAETREAVRGVNVYYEDKGGTRETVSDKNGYYELRVTDGQAVVTFKRKGYQTRIDSVYVNPGEFLTHDASLIRRGRKSSR